MIVTKVASTMLLISAACLYAGIDVIRNRIPYTASVVSSGPRVP